MFGILFSKFLKVFESIISKKPESFEVIREALINLENTPTHELENQKTRQGDAVFLTSLNEGLYQLLWSKVNEKIIILTVLK